jgi:hypothetical protein
LFGGFGFDDSQGILDDLSHVGRFEIQFRRARITQKIADLPVDARDFRFELRGQFFKIPALGVIFRRKFRAQMVERQVDVI